MKSSTRLYVTLLVRRGSVIYVHFVKPQLRNMHTINITEARNLGTLYCCGVSDRSRSNEMIREKRYKGRPVACHSAPENVP
jgi:hypothetical protein